ncbi:MAG TPA: SMI1/KNR4 family protein [Myxococcaceae bacterium]|nr:SMI1/KNR4 family protein [Myxococcaceae bacterium]
MANWIVGLRKAAVESRPGASEEALTRVEALVGLSLPVELRTLYAQMDGGSFEPDVALYALEQAPDAAGVAEATRKGLRGLPARGVWRFGLRGGGDHLFAAQHSTLKLPPETAPGWMKELPAEAWLYGRKNTDTGELEVFKSLQALLWHLIPPVESEDYGENTLAKAMNAVTDALKTLSGSDPGSPAMKKKPKRRAAKAKTSKVKAKAKKAAPKKKAAKKRR